MEVALARVSDKVEYEVQWLPYQLNPNASKGGVNKVQMYMEKFGRNKADTMRMAESMAQHFASVDLPFKFTEAALTGNTFNAHRLISYAHHTGGAEMQDKVMEELFKNYFAEEKFLNDPAVLKAAAMVGGLSEEEAVALVEDEELFAAETRTELKTGSEMGVRGVPFFLIENDDRHTTISGAQDSAVFIEEISKLL